MKTIFLIILLVSSSVFAQGGGAGAMGGQSGNGGNGCWIKTVKGETYWTSLEEIEYRSYYRSMIHFGYQEKSPIIAPKAKNDEIVELNIYNHSMNRRVQKKLNVLKKNYPATAERLIDWTKLFRNVHVVPNAIKGHYGAEIPKKSGICVDFSPAMAILENGTIILFRTVWNSLDNITQEVILVHEVLRLAQMFDPAFVGMTNQELQKLTAAISTRRTRLMNRPILEEIERNLLEERVEAKPFAHASYAKAILKKDSSKAFQIILQGAFNQNASSVANYVQVFKAREKHYNKLIVNELIQSFSAPLRLKAR